MRDLHEQLRNLVSQHGAGIAENAEQFRAALDDYLTEADASQGELNLLVDAVRLGGVERLLAMLDNGADSEAAVREAGGTLARDRSSDEQRARWAVAAMGYALGRVGGEVVRGQLEGEATRLPFGATAPAAPTPPEQSPVQSPPYQPPVQSPVQSPAWPTPSPQQSYPSPQPAYAAPPLRKRRTGLFLGLFIAGVAVATLAIVLVIVAPWEDSNNGGNDEATDGGGDPPTCEVCLEGEGYQYQLPDGWKEITDQVLEDNPGQPTLDTASAWGKSVEEGRANVITEVSSWSYDDLDDALLVLKTNLGSLGGTIEELEHRTIDGEEAAGVILTRNNDAGISVEQRAYIVRNGDDAVVITSSHKAGDDGPLDRYEEIYDSWSWE